MKRHVLLAAAAFAIFAPVGLASAQDAAMQTPEAMAAMKVTEASEFMTMAAMSDKFEIESSELAQEKAQSDAVKQFAQQMITDHTANTQKLMQTVEAGGGSMEAPGELDDRHQEIIASLEGVEGEAFDAAYIDAQVQAHAEAVALMTGYSQNGDNEPLKEFAQEALPIVQMHYEMVQKMDQGSM